MSKTYSKYHSKKNNTPFCSIIVLNYNGEKIIKNTVDSLVKLDYPQAKFEIIIVDNHSRDDSKRIITQLYRQYDNIVSVYLRDNLGFAKGNNIGIKRAKGKYVILLNNDCLVTRNWLKELVIVAEKDKSIFAVNSKILLYNTNKVQNAGILVFQDGYGRDIGALVQHQSQDYEQDRGQYDKEKEVYAACGAAVLYRKEIFEKIGYLDENFFMYYEDVEISERGRLHGYKILYAPKATVYHYHALSSKEWSDIFIYNAEKGRLLHIFYSFPFSVFIREYQHFIFLAFLRLFKEIYIFKMYKKNWQYFKIIIYFFISFTKLLFNRIVRNRNLPRQAINDNYQQILNGYWYFN
jgi:hypothetical protein